MASYDCGSMNWLNSGLFINSPPFLEKLGRVMQDNGIKPEIEAFDPGMIYNAAYYLKKGVLKAPLHFQFCMGCANGIGGSIKNLLFMKETMDSLVPGSTWSCFGVGHSAMEILYAAVPMGGHIRVGMEDNVMYSKGVPAESNVQLVARARRVIEEYGNKAATPAEAREIEPVKVRRPQEGVLPMHMSWGARHRFPPSAETLRGFLFQCSWGASGLEAPQLFYSYKFTFLARISWRLSHALPRAETASPDSVLK
jgi:hypothetical protein